MIQVAMRRVVDSLNAYVNVRSPGMTPDRVVAGSFFTIAGPANTTIANRIVVQVANVEENTIYRSMERYQPRADGVHERVKPEVRLNLYVLFIANIDIYDEALKAISLVVAFFQNHQAFEIAGNGNGSSRVVFELYSLTFEQQNHLWASLGAKYMPSIMYKASIVAVHDTQVDAEVRPVEEILTET